MTAKEMASRLGVEVLDRRRHYKRAVVLEVADEKGEIAPKVLVYAWTNGRKRFVGRMYASALKMPCCGLDESESFHIALDSEITMVGGGTFSEEYDSSSEEYQVVASEDFLQAFESLRDCECLDNNSEEAKARAGQNLRSLEEDICAGLYDDEACVALW